MPQPSETSRDPSASPEQSGALQPVRRARPDPAIENEPPMCDDQLLDRRTPLPEIGEVRALPRQQQCAALAIIAGRSFTAAAKAAGVTRQTIYNWHRNDPVFRVTIENFQANALQSARSRLLSLVDQAVTTVGVSIARGNSSLALDLLKQFSVLGGQLPEPSDPVDGAIKRHLRRRDEIASRERMLDAWKGNGTDIRPYERFKNETFVEQSPPDPGGTPPPASPEKSGRGDASKGADPRNPAPR